jgi:hypothetical protein
MNEPTAAALMYEKSACKGKEGEDGERQDEDSTCGALELRDLSSKASSLC